MSLTCDQITITQDKPGDLVFTVAAHITNGLTGDDLIEDTVYERGYRVNDPNKTLPEMRAEVIARLKAAVDKKIVDRATVASAIEDWQSAIQSGLNTALEGGG